MRESRRLGVIDLGRARFKAHVYQEDRFPRPIWSSKAETGMLIDKKCIDEVIDSFRTLAAATTLLTDSVVVCVGSLFRDPEWMAWLGPAVLEVSHATYVLDSQLEGGLLLAAARNDMAVADRAVIVDIGGGSVQVSCRAPNSIEAIVTSWPYGTHALEQMFDLRPGGPLAEYEKAADFLLRGLDVHRFRPCDRLFVGSNVMGTFMDCLSRHLNRPCRDWTIDSLEEAWRFCATLPEASFGEVFPQNPTFMRGADKAMLVAWALATLLEPLAVSGTDASVAQGVALLAFEALAEGRPLEAIPLRMLRSDNTFFDSERSSSVAG